MHGRYGRFFGALIGAVAGMCVGFGLAFYGYLMLHRPSPSGVEFEFASAIALLGGCPFGALLGAVLGYRTGRGRSIARG